MTAVTSPEHRQWAGQIKEWMAIYKQAEDIINIGAYAKGSNPKIDQAVSVIDRIQSYLRQAGDDPTKYSDSIGLLHGIVRSGEAFAAANKR
jgi:flagellum-specific ATP synthase